MQRLFHIRHLIIDMDGVLYRESEPMPGLVDFFDFLRQRDIRFVLATNNSTRTPEQFVQKMAGMGVSIATSDLITSAQATAAYLREIAPPGSPVYAVGQEGLETALQQAGFVLDSQRAGFVVAGLDTGVTYKKLETATLLIQRGAAFIGTNSDATLPTPEGLAPGAGAILAAIQTATGVAPTVIGKPAPTLFQQAMARLEATPADTATLGDRLETDILAGLRTGLLSLLVLSGATDRALLAQSAVQPDLVFEDIADLRARWAGLQS